MVRALLVLSLLVVGLLFGCGSDKQLASSLKADPNTDVKYSLLTSERMDFSAIPRLVVRIKVARELSREELEKQVRHAAYIAYKESPVTLGAVAVFAYDSNDINGGFSAASLDFAPYGKWEEANHKTPLERWKGEIQFAEGYFKPQPNLLGIGSAVMLYDKNNKPIFLSKKAGSLVDDDFIVNIPSGTKATLMDVYTLSYAGGNKMFFYQVKTKYKGKTYIGWVFQSQTNAE